MATSRGISEKPRRARSSAETIHSSRFPKAPPPSNVSTAREALTLNEALANTRGVAVALNNLGWIALYRGDEERAESHFLDSLEHRREIGDERGAAFTLANLALTRIIGGSDTDAVVGWLEQARALVEGLDDDRPLQGWVSCMESRLRMTTGNPDDALAQLDRDLLTWRDITHQDGLAWACLTRGDACARLEEPASARECFERSLALWRSMDCQWGTVTSLMRLAHLDDSEARYREALELSERFGLDGCARACRQALPPDREGTL